MPTGASPCASPGSPALPLSAIEAPPTQVTTAATWRSAPVRVECCIEVKAASGCRPLTSKHHASRWLSWPHPKPFPTMSPVGATHPALAGSSKSQSSGECILAATCCTRPTRPAATAADAVRVAGRQLAVLFTAKKRPASVCARAAAARAHASSTDVVIGFSMSTCTPA